MVIWRLANRMNMLKSTAGFYETDSSVRKVYDFNQGWLFYRGDCRNGHEKNCNEEAFKVVHLPHGVDGYEQKLSGMRNYQGKVWYRKHFYLDDEMVSDHLTLYFEGVMGKSIVYVDGHQICEHFGGYLPFHIDLYSLDLEGGEHVIAICADNSDDKSFPPGKPQDSLDFTYLGGVYRNTYLIRRKKIHMTLPTEAEKGGSVTAGTLSLSNREAVVLAGAEILNKFSQPVQLEVSLKIVSSNESEVAEKIVGVNISGEGRASVTEELVVTQPETWHPDRPVLYWLYVEVRDNQRILDKLKVRFGIRTLALDGQKGFILNGKLFEGKLNGTNRHQDYALVGNALPDSGQRRDALLLKKAGANVIRSAHYPLSPVFMDACDELGMFVSVANPGWQYYNLLNSKFGDRVIQDTMLMARRDKNRPSVLFWEIVLNETLAHPVKIVKKQHQIVHDEVPFESTITAGDMVIGKKAGLDLLFTGTKETKGGCTFWREYGDGPEVDGWVSQNASTRVARAWGEKPMLDQMLNRVKYLKELVNSDPGRIGGTLWCGIDHHRGYHPDPFTGGLLDIYRMPRYAYQLYQCQYAKESEVHIIHELTQISSSDVVVVSNCDKVRLRFMDLDRTLDIKKYKGKGGTIVLPLVFEDFFDFKAITEHYRGKTHKLKMIAEGIVGKKTVCKSEKCYAERTSGLRIISDDLGVKLLADGSDFFPVRIEVIDNKGVTKVLASERIYLDVSGEGELICPSDNDDGILDTEFGTATALIRSTLNPGKITLTAYAKGLKPVKAEFNSVAPSRKMLYEEAYSKRDILENTPRLEPIGKLAAEGQETDLEALQEENRNLRLQLTEKEQDIMELMSRLDIS